MRDLARRPRAGMVLGVLFDRGDYADTGPVGHSPTVFGTPTISTFVTLNTTNYIQYADHSSLDVADKLTLSFWVKLTDTGINYTVTKWSGTSGLSSYVFWINTGGFPYFTTSTTGNYASARDCVSTTAVNDGTWHHIVGVYDGSTTKIYIDGALDTTKTGTTGSLANVSSPVCIGAISSGGLTSWRMNGSLDDCLIFNQAISENVIGSIFEFGRR